MKTIKINGVGFNPEVVGKMTESDFIKLFKPIVWMALKPEEKEEELKKAYAILKPKNKG